MHIFAHVWVTNDHEQDVLVAERLGTPAPGGLPREYVCTQSRILILRFLIVILIGVGRCPNCFTAKDLLQTAILGPGSLVIRHLGRTHSGKANEQVGS